MTLRDTLSAFAHLPDDAQITVTVRKADLVKALEQRNGGPPIMTTIQAAETFGYTSDRWRKWAMSGVVEGARQDVEGGHWRLPRVGCEAHIAALAHRGRQPRASLAIVSRSRPRGPWKPTKAAGASS